MNRQPLPGEGIWGWLGRQVGYVSKALKTPVGSKTLWRSSKVEEKALRDAPELKFRRTTVDEVIKESPGPRGG